MMSVFCGDFFTLLKERGKKGENVLWDLEKKLCFVPFQDLKKKTAHYHSAFAHYHDVCICIFELYRIWYDMSGLCSINFGTK